MRINQTIQLGIAVSMLAFISTLNHQPALAQGSLIPPGPPGLTFRTLQQIEPRTPVDSANTPGNFLAQHIISQPGAYYLATNILGVSGKRGIQIETSNITLDLNGFSLQGAAGTLHGIYLTSASTTNVTIRNGIIAGWTGSGVYYTARNGLMEYLTVSGNNEGIRVGDACQVRRCTVIANAQNGVFAVGSGCLILDNHCDGNNTANSSSYAGIQIAGTGNRVEANQVHGSGLAGFGISVSAGYSSNVIVRNFVSGQGANSYSATGTQSVGPIISPSGTITNSNPWANFAY